jgi:DNA ligase 1
MTYQLKPMLATSYKAFAGACWSQPKLDGVRALATVDGLVSREGMPISTAPHVVEALAPIFRRNKRIVLDGELYSHHLNRDFDAIRASVQHTGAQALGFHVFDCVGGYDQGERLQRAGEAVGLADSPHVSIVPTVYCEDQAGLDAAGAGYLAQGYEGQIVRRDGFYEGGRRLWLQKRKQFDDSEYIFEGLADKGANSPMVAICRTIQGGRFEANVRASQALIAGQGACGAKAATVRHFGYTSHGLPRHGVVVAFHQGRRLH